MTTPDRSSSSRPRRSRKMSDSTADKGNQSTRKLTLKRDGDKAADAPKLEERLHKVLAQAGLGSRRALEQRIADGLVKVNGEIAQAGMSATGGDKHELDVHTFLASASHEPHRMHVQN